MGASAARRNARRESVGTTEGVGGPPEWRRVMRSTFGLEEFRPGQEEVIARLMAGKSAAAIFPTGGGKSLCYQLPALLLEGLTLVVSPLMALMREQVDFLLARGVAAARLDSSLSGEQLRAVGEQLRRGEVRILYVAPERFFNERFRAMLGQLKIDLLAIDEAHCISQWGHNFRPDYLKLALAAREFDVARVLALTATATPEVVKDIGDQFGIASEDVVTTPFYRSNLRLECRLCTDRSRESQLHQLMADTAGTKRLIYVTFQRTAEELGEQLHELGFPARAYHAGMDDQQRRQVQDWFASTADAIVVATIAFGMGIDVADIRAIVHYNPSKSLESYAQEIGRAGRDGRESRCVTLLVPDDRIALDNFAYGDTPAWEDVRRLVEILAGQPQQFYVSYYALGRECDLRDAVLRTMMTEMELEGFIEAVAPRYEECRFKPLVSSNRILENFQGEPRRFAHAVLAMTVKRKVWFDLNLTTVADRLQVDRQRIIRMLDYFEQQGWIELKLSGLVHGYRYRRRIDNVDDLAARLHERAMERQRQALARIDSLYDWYTAQECLHGRLCRHFGQHLAQPCGHCQVCAGQPLDAVDMDDSPRRVGDSALQMVRQLAARHPDVLRTSWQRARFLAGLSSPRMVASRLTRHAGFGCCRAVPFERILESVGPWPEAGESGGR
ncbi:MAG: ATP-dependent DNA helicase RecQ [Pirellulaceae bacterium]|nr:MAG: ATP-dependent DNA helicase RecQ [Pirellulaceae bacterium]